MRAMREQEISIPHTRGGWGMFTNLPEPDNTYSPHALGMGGKPAEPQRNHVVFPTRVGDGGDEAENDCMEQQADLADGIRLENGRGRKPLVGPNPTCSAYGPVPQLVEGAPLEGAQWRSESSQAHWS